MLSEAFALDRASLLERYSLRILHLKYRADMRLRPASANGCYYVETATFISLLPANQCQARLQKRRRTVSIVCVPGCNA